MKKYAALAVLQLGLPYVLKFCPFQLCPMSLNLAKDAMLEQSLRPSSRVTVFGQEQILAHRKGSQKY